MKEEKIEYMDLSDLSDEDLFETIEEYEEQVVSLRASKWSKNILLADRITSILDVAKTELKKRLYKKTN